MSAQSEGRQAGRQAGKGGAYCVARLLGVGKGELAIVFFASAFGLPELLTLLVIVQVKHLLGVFLISELQTDRSQVYKDRHCQGCRD